MKKILLSFLFLFLIIGCTSQFISANHPESRKKLEKGNHGILMLSFMQKNEVPNFINVHMVVQNQNDNKKIPIQIKSTPQGNAEKQLKTTESSKIYYSNYILSEGTYKVSELFFSDGMYLLNYNTDFIFEIKENSITYLGEFLTSPIESKKGNVVLLGSKTIIDVESKVSDKFSRDSASIFNHFIYMKSLKLNKEIPSEIPRLSEIKIKQTQSIPIIVPS